MPWFILGYPHIISIYETKSRECQWVIYVCSRLRTRRPNNEVHERMSRMRKLCKREGWTIDKNISIMTEPTHWLEFKRYWWTLGGDSMKMASVKARLSMITSSFGLRSSALDLWSLYQALWTDPPGTTQNLFIEARSDIARSLEDRGVSCWIV